MNANDATITEVATAQTGSNAEDNAPNAPGPGVANFDVLFAGVAGGAIGNGGGPYVLTITCVDETTQAPVPPLSVPPQNQAFNAALWQPAGPNFISNQRFPVGPIPANLDNHVLRYYASMVNANAQIVSLFEGDLFTVVA